MESKEFVKFTAEVKHGDNTPVSKVIVETNHSDVTGEEACQMFFTSMIGLTFYPETILKSMLNFVEEKAPELLENYYTNAN